MADPKKGKGSNAKHALGVGHLLPATIRHLLPLDNGKRAKPSDQKLTFARTQALNLSAVRAKQAEKPKLDLLAQSKARQKMRPRSTASINALDARLRARRDAGEPLVQRKGGLLFGNRTARATLSPTPDKAGELAKLDTAPTFPAPTKTATKKDDGQ